MIEQKKEQSTQRTNFHSIADLAISDKTRHHDPSLYKVSWSVFNWELYRFWTWMRE